MQRVGKSSVVDTDQQCTAFASAIGEVHLGAISLLDLEGLDANLLDLLWGLISVLGLRAGCHGGLCDLDSGGVVDSRLVVGRLAVDRDRGQWLELGIRLAKVKRHLEARQ